MENNRIKVTASHWGVGTVVVDNGRLVSVDAHPDDPAPSPINANIASSLNGAARVLRPSVREGWLKHGPLARVGERGRDPLVEVDWDTALDLIAEEHNRVTATYGNEAIFAGSYGWASAGRFHHAQSQLKRFLNQFGGFVRSEGNYSYSAALTLMPHIIGDFRANLANATRWNVIARHTNLVVMFGGIARRNTQVADGGLARHRVPGQMEDCARAGVRFVNLSPLRTDAATALNAEWLPPRPGTDTAVMMGLAHTLIVEGLHDRAFLAKYTVGYDRLEAYLLGAEDGVVKDADWAAAQSGIDAHRIRALARDMAGGRTMICSAIALQRADFGEQPLWMTIALAAMLGQIGLPGGGYGIGYGANGIVGTMERPFRWANLPQGLNPVEAFIPVAMIAEMLLHPGASFEFNGQHMRFPDIRMVWWAGGNPFHHHQDLNRLRQAFRMPETIIINEINWTSTARHADIILPCAAPQERMDFSGGHTDNALIPMPRHVLPPGEAKCEFDIYAALEKRMGGDGHFGGNLSADQWVEKLWQDTQVIAARHGTTLPDWVSFIRGDAIMLTDPAPERVFLAGFREDPLAHPLSTPSGRIELFSETISAFDYSDCPGHPTWLAPRDVADGKAAQYPLYLLSGQPQTRLHSQLDNGDYSMSGKISGREPVQINPFDAGARDIADGDIVELYNDRGCCLASTRVTDDIARGNLFLATGAWYDPDLTDPKQRDRHGNPNVLTHDQRTSRLSQGPASHSALVEVRRATGTLPDITIHRPPNFISRTSGE